MSIWNNDKEQEATKRVAVDYFRDERKWGAFIVDADGNRTSEVLLASCADEARLITAEQIENMPSKQESSPEESQNSSQED